MPVFSIGFSDTGRWTAFPSVFVTVDADNLDLRPVSPVGVVAILAEGDGMFPPGVATQMPMGAGSPQRFIRPSTLLTAVEYAVKPFSEFDRGAGEVVVVPVNKSTPSTMLLNKSGPTLAATLTSKGFGTFMNTILVKSEAGKLTVSLPTDTGPPITEIYTYSTVAGLVADINARSGIVKATFTSEGTLVTFANTAMSGATSPAAVNSDWDEALQALNGRRINTIAVCSPTAAHWAMLADYCILHRCRGYIGSEIKTWNGVSNRQTSIATLKSEAAGLNAPRMMHIGLGADGLPGYASTAPRVAALMAAIPPSVPGTFKHLDFTSLEANLDQISEVGGTDGLLLYGVAPPVPDPSAPATSLLSRGKSTWTGDANLYRHEHSVLAAVDAIQDQVEEGARQFLGNEGTAAVASRAINMMDQILYQATLQTSYVRINSYRRASINAYVDGQVLYLSAAFTPIPPINFIPVSLVLERTEIVQTFQVPLS